MQFCIIFYHTEFYYYWKLLLQSTVQCLIDSAYYSTMFMQTELLPSILISELQNCGYKQYGSTTRITTLHLVRSSIGKILHSTWRNTSLQDASFYLETYTLYYRSISNRFYNSTSRTTSLQELPQQGTLESPIDSTRATYSPNSTNKNFLLEESTRAFCKEKSGQEFYQRKYF